MATVLIVCINQCQATAQGTLADLVLKMPAWNGCSFRCPAAIPGVAVRCQLGGNPHHKGIQNALNSREIRGMLESLGVCFVSHCDWGLKGFCGTCGCALQPAEDLQHGAHRTLSTTEETVLFAQQVTRTGEGRSRTMTLGVVKMKEKANVGIHILKSSREQPGGFQIKSLGFQNQLLLNIIPVEFVGFSFP